MKTTTELRQIIEDSAPPVPDFADERVRQARQLFDERMGDISDLLEQVDAIAILITEAVTERHINSAASAIVTLLSNPHDALSAACTASRDMEVARGQVALATAARK